MEENRLQDIFIHLKESGFDARMPGTTLGECKSKYIVVRFNGEAKHGNFSTNDTYYGVLCYVPKNKYSELETFLREVQKAMKELEPMILPTGEISTSFYDDNVKAHYSSVGYKNYKRRL